MNKGKTLQKRRDRHKAKASGWTRQPSSKVGHHITVSHFVKGAKSRIPTS